AGSEGGVDGARGQAPRGEVVRQGGRERAATGRIRRDLAEGHGVSEVVATAVVAPATGRVATTRLATRDRGPMRPGDADDAALHRRIEGLERVDAHRLVRG